MEWITIETENLKELAGILNLDYVPEDAEVLKFDNDDTTTLVNISDGNKYNRFEVGTSPELYELL